MAGKLTLDRNAMRNKATAHLRIYVGGLTDDCTEDDLYEHFIPYGQIDGIVVNRVFGFVQFREAGSVQLAIEKGAGSVLKGKKISVKAVLTNESGKFDTSSGQAEKPAPNDSAGNHPDKQDDLYDSFGNYIGDQGDAEDHPQEGYENQRGRGRGGLRGRGRGRGQAGFREMPPHMGGAEWGERSFERYPEYPRSLPIPERNDCEIIVVSKSLTEYAEYIESRLKRLGIVVDLLFPMEDVPIGRVLGNIASRGCLYAILVMPTNQENRSLTLTILHGLPQEHRNMPIEDALQLLSRNFHEVRRGGSSGREAVYALLGQLADGRTLTVLQYEKVIEYLQERKEQQVKLELGEPLATNKTQVDLQQRILSILNDKKTNVESPPPAPVPAPVMPPARPEQNKLLNDPTVRKALDSILLKFT
ncbi:nuclear receptor coactivator 5 [Leptidea sinapis]|uniref:nuclear receptor coactivator 5 n=1 Tax=Leptidea sinapis TaxID=189913 RepID=UPI0021C3CC7B|nr:nuclear receptor coactivator 5 [Leptidea sinapis]